MCFVVFSSSYSTKYIQIRGIVRAVTAQSENITAGNLSVLCTNLKINLNYKKILRSTDNVLIFLTLSIPNCILEPNGLPTLLIFLLLLT